MLYLQLRCTHADDDVATPPTPPRAPFQSQSFLVLKSDGRNSNLGSSGPRKKDGIDSREEGEEKEEEEEQEEEKEEEQEEEEEASNLLGRSFGCTICSPSTHLLPTICLHLSHSIRASGRFAAAQIPRVNVSIRATLVRPLVSF